MLSCPVPIHKWCTIHLNLVNNEKNYIQRIALMHYAFEKQNNLPNLKHCDRHWGDCIRFGNMIQAPADQPIVEQILLLAKRPVDLI